MRGGVVDHIERVIAFVGILLHQGQFARLVDGIGIVALASDHGVQAGATVELVVAIVTGQHVVLCVADTVDVGSAGKDEVFQVGTQGEGDRRTDDVDLAGQGAGLDHDIADVVDDVGVVASAADHDVGAGTAVEDVVTRVAGDAVVQGVAGAIEIGGAEQVQPLDVGAQGVVDRAVDGVDFRGRGVCLDDHVADVVDVIAVVAGAANHGVRTTHAVKHVVQRVTDESVVKSRAVGVFDLGAIGNGQSFVEGRHGIQIKECLADLAELSFVQVDTNGRELVAAIDGIDATRIVNSLEYGLVGCPVVKVVARLPLGIRTVQLLNGEDVQQHRAGRLVGVIIVVAHHRVTDIVQCGIEDCLVVTAGFKRMFESQGMANFVQKRQIVI